MAETEENTTGNDLQNAVATGVTVSAGGVLGGGLGGSLQSLMAWFDRLGEEKDELKGTVTTAEEQTGDAPLPQPNPFRSSGTSDAMRVDLTSLENPFAAPGKGMRKRQSPELLNLYEAVWGDSDNVFSILPAPAAAGSVDILGILEQQVETDAGNLVEGADILAALGFGAGDASDFKFTGKDEFSGAGYMTDPHEMEFIRRAQGGKKDAPELSEAEQALLDIINAMNESGGGRGGGGPKYQGPDRRAVEEAVEDQMILLAGGIDAGAVSSIVDSYLRDDKRRFEGKDIDPNQTLLEGVRALQTYKDIHQNRPEQANEKTWISNQRQAFLQGGGSMQNADQRAIDLATIGAAPSTASADNFELARGRTTVGFMDKIKKSTAAAVSRIN